MFFLVATLAFVEIGLICDAFCFVVAFGLASWLLVAFSFWLLLLICFVSFVSTDSGWVRGDFNDSVFL